jgi:mono/diheme cytochrome c family protein
VKKRLEILILGSYYLILTVALCLTAVGRAAEVQYDLQEIEVQKPGEMTMPVEEATAFHEAGRQVYIKRCLFCHGRFGMGDGVAARYLDPRPRDFTLGMFKFRSTGSGGMPTDADLFRTVSRGIPGTAMPAWGEGDFTLSEIERWQVIYFVKSMVIDFQNEDLDPYVEGRQVPIGTPPPPTPERLAHGRDLFMKSGEAGCFECHGKNGRGNGGAAGNHTDDWGDFILPQNLTKPWRFKNGSRVRDIFRTLTLGLNGTPMPSFIDAMPNDQDRWDVALFVHSLQKPYSPDNSVIEAVKIDGALPQTPDDPAWAAAAAIDIVTGGQVVLGPRWQNNSVDVVAAQALYNNEEVAFRFVWDDRFENLEKEETAFDPNSPAASAETIEDEVVTSNDRAYEWDEIEALGDLWQGKDTYLPVDAARIRATIGNLPDQLAIHFPVKLPLPGKSEKPYIFKGDPKHQVNAWQWIAGSDRVLDSNAKGPASSYKLQDGDGITPVASSAFNDGQWQLVLRRKLTGDDRVDTPFVPGQLIPFTTRVWDGSAGEAGRQSAISASYFVMLKTTTPKAAYCYGLLGAAAMLVLQIVIAQRLRRTDNLKDR